jgi:hypothetical protein
MVLITANQRGISAVSDRGYKGMVRAGLALNDESGKLRTHAHARSQ